MSERPILFTGDMVRATLERRKTKTRRTRGLEKINLHPERFRWMGLSEICGEHIFSMLDGKYDGAKVGVKCPYGQPGDKEWRTGVPPNSGFYYVRGLLDASIGGDDRAVWLNTDFFTWGFSESDDPEAMELDSGITKENIQWKRPGDRLWVRETWRGVEIQANKTCLIAYKADGTRRRWSFPNTATVDTKWHPSIHMPRWASRITLEIVSVRVERLQEISEEDAINEGVSPVEVYGEQERNFRITSLPPRLDFRRGFTSLWDSLNSKRGFPWASNPWVWVIEFRVMAPIKPEDIQ